MHCAGFLVHCAGFLVHCAACSVQGFGALCIVLRAGFFGASCNVQCLKSNCILDLRAGFFGAMCNVQGFLVVRNFHGVEF